jgi:hypothetical protein
MRYENLAVNRLIAGTINGFPFPGGVGMGKAIYLCKADSATSKYQDWLVANGVNPADVYETLPAAYAACTGDRNDTIFAFPGTYTQTAKITWAKNSTHLIGVGSRNQRIPATAGTYGNVYFPCVTAMTEEFLITGHHCEFQNFSTYLSTATGEADIKVNGRNTTLKNIFMKSGQDSTQIASAVLGYGLWCDGSAAGYCNGLLVEGCHIGDPRNTVRTAGGMIYMVGNASGNAAMCYEFKDCFISGWSATAGVSAVYQSGNYSTDRYVLWQDCTFYNFQTNLGTILTAGVFNDTSGTTHMNMLTGRTCQYGWNVWGNNDAYCFGSMPIPDVVGGKMLTLT